MMGFKLDRRRAALLAAASPGRGRRRRTGRPGCVRRHGGARPGRGAPASHTLGFVISWWRDSMPCPRPPGADRGPHALRPPAVPGPDHRPQGRGSLR